MEFTAKQLAQVLKGTVEGDPAATVTGFARIETGKPGKLCFLANPKYEPYAYTCRASILLVSDSFAPKEPVSPTLIRVPDAYSAIATLLKFAADQKKSYRRRRSLRSSIACSAKLGKKVSVGAFTRIGKNVRIGDYGIIHDNVTIGEGTVIGRKCLIYPGVRIYPGTVIGDNVILHENCVIGSDGFGNAPQPDGSWEKIEHLGNVEIGSGTTVDRAEMESTVIGNGVRIDNLCQIAHNVQIGENTAMAAMCGIAGSTKIGKNCILAGQVGIVGHITIADNTTIAAQAGVIGSIRKPGQTVVGMPAIDLKQYMRSYVKFKQAGLEE